MNTPPYYYSRRTLAIFAFFGAWYCLYQYFVTDFKDHYLILIMLLLFVFSYFVAPYSNGRQTTLEKVVLWDQWLLLGFYRILFLPIRFILYLIRHVVD